MRACPICQKHSAVGGGYSNRVRATKFNPVGKSRRYPNLQWAPLPQAKGTENRRIKICAKCLKAGKNLTYVSR